MALITLSGSVSGVVEKESPAGWKYLSFRIGDRPVTSNLAMNLMENDPVKAVGEDAPEPQIEALRNEKTKVEYVPPELPVSFPVGGIIISVILIPFFLIGLGFLFFVWNAYGASKKALERTREIKRLLKG